MHARAVIISKNSSSVFMFDSIELQIMLLLSRYWFDELCGKEKEMME